MSGTRLDETHAYPVVVDDFGDDGDFAGGGSGVEEDDWAG